MKKIGLVILAAMAFIMGGVINAHQVSADTDPLHERLYRVYNPNSGEHLLTPAGWEVLTLEKAGWKSEGVAFYIPLSDFEAASLLSIGWNNDGTAFRFPVAKANTGVPVYRLYNPNAKVGSHHFTMSSFERDSLIKAGWKNEGIAFNAYTK